MTLECKMLKSTTRIKKKLQIHNSQNGNFCSYYNSDMMFLTVQNCFLKDEIIVFNDYFWVIHLKTLFERVVLFTVFHTHQQYHIIGEYLET